MIWRTLFERAFSPVEMQACSPRQFLALLERDGLINHFPSAGCLSEPLIMPGVNGNVTSASGLSCTSTLNNKMMIFDKLGFPTTPPMASGLGDPHLESASPGPPEGSQFASALGEDRSQGAFPQTNSGLRLIAGVLPFLQRLPHVSPDVGYFSSSQGWERPCAGASPGF